ncbi:hypothetical protein BC828DRAFT_373226 [Blastocladiella britannica]|nr:hypothetical protein BC828DRAFT_373226 [Blastocladiella britannica]
MTQQPPHQHQYRRRQPMDDDLAGTDPPRPYQPLERPMYDTFDPAMADPRRGRGTDSGLSASGDSSNRSSSSAYHSRSTHGPPTHSFVRPSPTSAPVLGRERLPLPPSQTPPSPPPPRVDAHMLAHHRWQAEASTVDFSSGDGLAAYDHRHADPDVVGSWQQASADVGAAQWDDLPGWSTSARPLGSVRGGLHDTDYGPSAAAAYDHQDAAYYTPLPVLHGGPWPVEPSLPLSLPPLPPPGPAADVYQSAHLRRPVYGQSAWHASRMTIRPPDYHTSYPTEAPPRASVANFRAVGAFRPDVPLDGRFVVVGPLARHSEIVQLATESIGPRDPSTFDPGPRRSAGGRLAQSMDADRLLYYAPRGPMHAHARPLVAPGGGPPRGTPYPMAPPEWHDSRFREPLVRPHPPPPPPADRTMHAAHLYPADPDCDWYGPPLMLRPGQAIASRNPHMRHHRELDMLREPLPIMGPYFPPRSDLPVPALIIHPERVAYPSQPLPTYADGASDDEAAHFEGEPGLAPPEGDRHLRLGGAWAGHREVPRGGGVRAVPPMAHHPDYQHDILPPPRPAQQHHRSLQMSQERPVTNEAISLTRRPGVTTAIAPVGYEHVRDRPASLLTVATTRSSTLTTEGSRSDAQSSERDSPALALSTALAAELRVAWRPDQALPTAPPPSAPARERRGVSVPATQAPQRPDVSAANAAANAPFGAGSGRSRRYHIFTRATYLSMVEVILLVAENLLAYQECCRFIAPLHANRKRWKRLQGNLRIIEGAADGRNLTWVRSDRIIVPSEDWHEIIAAAHRSSDLLRKHKSPADTLQAVCDLFILHWDNRHSLFQRPIPFPQIREVYETRRSRCGILSRVVDAYCRSCACFSLHTEASGISREVDEDSGQD